jgi:hypothetical protein
MQIKEINQPVIKISYKSQIITVWSDLLQRQIPRLSSNLVSFTSSSYQQQPPFQFLYLQGVFILSALDEHKRSF